MSAAEAQIIRDVKAKFAMQERKLLPLYILIGLIPFAIIVYLFYANFIAAHQFTYFYDIGSANENYLSPANRVSLPVTQASYRNMTSQLVYFSVPVTRGASEITVIARYYNSFPEKASFSLGAKNAENWSYQWKALPINEQGWIVANQSYNLSDLTVQNGQLSLVFSAPHLNENNDPSPQNHIPIDWISTTVYKPGWNQ